MEAVETKITLTRYPEAPGRDIAWIDDGKAEYSITSDLDAPEGFVLDKSPGDPISVAHGEEQNTWDRPIRLASARTWPEAIKAALEILEQDQG